MCRKGSLNISHIMCPWWNLYAYYFKEVALKAACCALVVKDILECLYDGWFLRKLGIFRSDFTFAKQQALSQLFFEGALIASVEKLFWLTPNDDCLFFYF